MEKIEIEVIETKSGIDNRGICRGCGIKCQSTEEDDYWDYCECIPNSELD